MEDNIELNEKLISKIRENPIEYLESITNPEKQKNEIIYVVKNIISANQLIYTGVKNILFPLMDKAKIYGEEIFDIKKMEKEETSVDELRLLYLVLLDEDYAQFYFKNNPVDKYMELNDKFRTITKNGEIVLQEIESSGMELSENFYNKLIVENFMELYNRGVKLKDFFWAMKQLDDFSPIINKYKSNEISLKEILSELDNTSNKDEQRLVFELACNAQNKDDLGILVSFRGSSFTSRNMIKTFIGLYLTENPQKVTLLQQKFEEIGFEITEKMDVELLKYDLWQRAIKANPFQIDALRYVNSNEREKDEFFAKNIDAILSSNYVVSSNTPYEFVRVMAEKPEDFVRALAVNFKDLYFYGDEFRNELPYEYREEIEKIEFAHGRVYNWRTDVILDNDIINKGIKKAEQILDLLRQNPDNIYDIQNSDLADEPLISTDKSQEIVRIILSTDYKITDDTPYFLRGNQEFLIGYIAKNESIDGLKPYEIAPLLIQTNIKKLNKVEGFYKAVEVVSRFVDTDLSKYIQSWGGKNTFEIFEKYGRHISKLSLEKSYTLEMADEEFRNRVKNLAGIADEGSVEELQTIAKYRPTQEEIEHNEFFSESYSTFKLLIAENPRNIIYYKGYNQELFKEALNAGYSPTIEDYRVSKGFKTSEAIVESLLNKYDDSKILQEIIEKIGIFDVAVNNNSLNLLQKKHVLEFINEIDDKEKFFDEHNNLSRSARFICMLINTYDTSYLKYYNGYDVEEVINEALANGYIPKFEDLKGNDKLYGNKKLIEIGINGNAEKGIDGDLRFYAYYLALDEVQKDVNEIQKTIKAVIGKEEFDKIFDTKEKREELGMFATIPEPGEFEFFDAINSSLVQAIGYDSWKNVIRYAFKNEYMKDLIELAKNPKKFENFQELFQNIKEYIKDDKAEGVNKFMYLSHAYNENANLFISIEKYIKSGNKLSSIQIQNLETYIYSSYMTDADKKEIKSIKDLENLVEIDRKRNKKNLERSNITAEDIKSDMISFIFGMKYEDAELFLGKNHLANTIDTLTISRIIEQAEKSGNKNLEMYARSMFVPVDILEQLVYSTVEPTELIDMAKKLYLTPEEEVLKLRKNFGNMFEKAREFYEYEINSQLTDLSKAAANPDIIKYDEEGNKIIDLSKSKHMILASIMGHDEPEKIVEKFFNSGAGKATICVSIETDAHEAYYYEDKSALRFGFTHVNSGGFIANNRNNAGSNRTIKENDIDIRGVSRLFKQTASRTSFVEEKEDSAHSESLLFRVGLLPTCIEMTGDVPTKAELRAKKAIEEMIEKTTGRKQEIYLVRTQHEHKRVLDYEKNSEFDKDTGIAENLEDKVIASKKAMEVYSLNKNDHIIRHNNALGLDYVTDGVKTFAIHRGTIREKAAIQVASEIQTLVYGINSPNVIQYRKVRDEKGQEVIATKVSSALSLGTYSRKDEAPSLKSKKIFLKEFIVDHLICNYGSGNLDFLIDTDGEVLGIKKMDALKSAEFMKQKTKDANGKQYYTAFSPNFYDGYNEGNNVYRKIFEDFVNNPDSSKVFSRNDLLEFIEICDRIKRIPEDEYIKTLEPVLKTYNGSERVDITNLLLERKRSLGDEGRFFVKQLVEQRKERITQKEYESKTVAFITDIHGNVEALESLIQECEKQGRTDIFILGDTIGFGPQSNECIDCIMKYQKQGLNISAIKGNHEMYCVMGDTNFSQTSGFEKELTDITRSSLSPENRRWVENLPVQRDIIVDGKKVKLIHFPEAPNRKRAKEDSEYFVGHNEGVKESETGIKEEADIVLYGHEHNTEALVGNETGEVKETKNSSNIRYVNLPSSGCVQGNNTSMCVPRTNAKDELEIDWVQVKFEREGLVEAIIKTNNPKGSFFGVTKQEIQQANERIESQNYNERKAR